MKASTKKERKYPVLKKVQGRMREYGETYRSLSDKTGIKLVPLNDKLNGYTLCDILEVSKICSVLDIPPEEIPIFFEVTVA